MKNRLSANKSKIIYILISIEIVLIIFLASYVVTKRSNILGESIIIPVNKNSVITNHKTDLKYFVEPKPNSIETVNEWGPYKGTYTINSDSLNERFDYIPEKPKNTYRIITLGDSYTYGLYVDTPDNWTEQLEDELNRRNNCGYIDKFEVINLGVHGYDIQMAAERFRLRGVKYNPDLIVWLIKSDDLFQVNEVMGEKLAQYPPGQGYENWRRAAKETVDELGLDYIYSLQKKLISNFLETYPNKVIFITFPSVRNFPYDMIEDTLSQYKEKTDFHYLDDIYKNQENYYKNDQHPTVQGHKIIAENVNTYLSKSNIIPCK